MTVTNSAQDAYRSTFWDRWRYGALRLVSVAADDSRFRGLEIANWVNVTINVLSTLLVLAVFYAAFRSRRAVDPLTEDDEKRLRTLLDRHGDRDSLGYFALRQEKSVIWSPTGKAAVAYRVVGGVSLASGDPIGDPEAWPGAIEPWLAEARAHGWIPAVMGASEEAGTVYSRHGLDALELGDEAIVETAEFTLEDAPCARSARPTTGSSGPGTRCASGGTRTSRPTRWRTSCGAPTTGGTGPPSAGSAWRSDGSATRATGSA